MNNLELDRIKVYILNIYTKKGVYYSFERMNFEK